MQMNQVPPQQRRPSLQQGLIFGVIVGILFAINTLLGNFVNLGVASTIVSFILFLVGLFLYAVAGFRTAAQTGRVGSAAIAGLLAGLIGGIIGLIVSVIVVIANVDRLRILSQNAADQLHRQSPNIPIVHYTNGTIITSELVLAIGLLLFAIGMGAAFGAIGGAIGRRRAPHNQIPYQEQFYQGMPPTPMNPAGPYNQGYPQNQAYPQNPGYAPNNQENPYPYNQPPQPDPTNPSNPYNQGNQGNPPPQPPSSNPY